MQCGELYINFISRWIFSASVCATYNKVMVDNALSFAFYLFKLNVMHLDNKVIRMYMQGIHALHRLNLQLCVAAKMKTDATGLLKDTFLMIN